MAKLKEGDEVALRVRIERVWPSGEITIFIKSASAGGKVTLIDDRDVLPTPETKKGP
jgi:hypothetical protein